MKKYYFLLIGIIILAVIVMASYYAVKRKNEMKGWIFYGECVNIGGEIVNTSSKYNTTCPINKKYVAKVKDMAIWAICCK